MKKGSVTEMDSDNGDRSRLCHVVAVPFPGRGHVNPMLNFCELLVSRRDDILITFVVTEEWLGIIGSDDIPPRIRFGTIPNVIPSERVRGADIFGFIEEVLTKMEDPFERLLDGSTELPVTAIVADSFLPWAVRVGNRRNIPVVSLWTMSASVFSIFRHFNLLLQNGHHPVEILERGDEVVDYIPGLSPTRIADFQALLPAKNPILPRTMESISLVDRAQYLVLASAYELEPEVIHALKSMFPFPVYPVGPLIPYFKPADSSSGDLHLHYFRWLDSQPCGSVLYVSFGSVVSVSSAQMDEIAVGLRDAGIRFLWAAHGETSGLKEACGEMGLVVPWCDQLKVLQHSSVGGFWTHCGWNSIVEGLFSGLPFLTFPVGIDQFSNSKAVVEDWKIGWRVKRDRDQTLVRREEISGIVKRFMDSESMEVTEMKRRARKFEEICRQATGKDGSSESNINALIRDITRLPNLQ